MAEKAQVDNEWEDSGDDMDQSTIRMEPEEEEEVQTEVQPDEEPIVEKIVDVFVWSHYSSIRILSVRALAK